MVPKTDSEQLFLIAYVPDSNLVSAPSRKNFTEFCRENDLADRLRLSGHEADLRGKRTRNFTTM